MDFEKLLERAKNVKYSGEIENPDAVGEVVNPRCGDTVKISMTVKDNKIEKIGFTTPGCFAAIVSADCLCELAQGKTLEEAEKITGEDVLKAFGGEIPPVKIHCTELALGALKKAIENYQKKN